MELYVCGNCEKVCFSEECVFCKSNNEITVPKRRNGSFCCQKNNCEDFVHVGPVNIQINLDHIATVELDERDIQSAAKNVIEVMYVSEGMLCPNHMLQFVSDCMTNIGIPLIAFHHNKRTRKEFEDGWA